MSKYNDEFPDFGELDVSIPEGFVDDSWHNDAMPSFAKRQDDGSFIRLWVDYKNPEMSEFKGDPYTRFLLSKYDSEMSWMSDIARSNDFDDILKVIDSLQISKKSSLRP